VLGDTAALEVLPGVVVVLADVTTVVVVDT
jgi:hypothetical protein